MKKIVIVFIVLIFSYSISVKTIHADVGDPYAFFGNIVISNPDGVEYTTNEYYGNKKIFIPYGEVLKPERMAGKQIEVFYEGDYAWINCEDVKPLEEYYYPNHHVDFDNNYKERVVLNDVPALYKGPALCYEKIDWMTIPKFSTIKCDSYDLYWHYVEYEGMEGWLYLFEITEEEGLSNKPLLADFCGKTGTLDGTTKVDLKYIFTYGKGIKYYAEGENFSGLVIKDSVWVDNEDEHGVYITSDNLTIYGDSQLTQEIDHIKCDGEYKLIRYKESLSLGRVGYIGAYIEYEQGKEGFVDCDEVVAIWRGDISAEYPEENSNGICYLYNKPIVSKDNIIAEIPEGYKIIYQYCYCALDDEPKWMHVDDGKYCGWILQSETYRDAKELYKEQHNEEIITNEQKEEKNLENEKDINKEEHTDEEKNRGKQSSFNIFDVIESCIIVILLIGSVIVLVNKKEILEFIKKNK